MNLKNDGLTVGELSISIAALIIIGFLWTNITKDKGNSKIKISFNKENKNYLFELKDKRKFDYETLKYLNKEPYIKKISV